MSCFVSAICLASRNKTQDAGWALVYMSCPPFISLGALIPTIISLRGFQQVQFSLPGPLGVCLHLLVAQ